MEEKINTGSQASRDEPTLMVSELKAIKDFCKGASDAIAVVDRTAVVAGKRTPDGANTSRAMSLRFTSAFKKLKGYDGDGSPFSDVYVILSELALHMPGCLDSSDIDSILRVSGGLDLDERGALETITFNVPVFLGIDFVPRKKIECAVIVREKDKAIMFCPIGDQVEEALLSAMQDIRDDLLASDIVAYTGI